MTSARSRRPRLNGSRPGLWMFCGLLLIGCAAPRPAVRKPSGPVSVDRPETTREYDPATDTWIVKPVTPAPDTLRWTEDPRPPAVTDVPAGKPATDTGKSDSPVNPPLPRGDESIVQIAVALPLGAFSAGQKPDPKQLRFLQYYAGLRLALEEAETRSRRINLRVREAVEVLQADPENEADILIGPYSRDTIEALLQATAGRDVVILSPWLPAFTPQAPQAGLIQLTPGLERHAEAIMAFIRQDMPGQQIVLVARNEPAEKSRLSLFSKYAAEDIRELIVTDKSAGLEGLDLTGYMKESGTVFILPYYARQDENFVNSFMRKLHADKGTKPVTVFGLPQWTGFANLNTSYMESLSLHLSQPAWPWADPAVLKAFRDKFYARHQTVPDLNAWQGYDLGRWLVETVDRYGKRGLTQAGRPWNDGLCSGFDIRPVRADVRGTDTMLYYENASIRIIRFKDQDFVLVR